MKNTFFSTSIALITLCATPQLSAHCQIPCGIYADDNVFVTLQTDQQTIVKSMEQINNLSKNPDKNANQIVRWVNNKEKHAQAIQDTIAQYFLAQRIKIGEPDKETYATKLALIHQITVYAMLCKQTTDPENATKLLGALNAFQLAYTGKPVTTLHDH